MKSLAFSTLICLVVLLSVGNEGYKSAHNAVGFSHLKPATTKPKSNLALNAYTETSVTDERVAEMQLKSAVSNLNKSADTLLDTFSGDKSVFVLINLLMMAPIGKVLHMYKYVQLNQAQALKWLTVSFIAAAYLTRDKNRWYHSLYYATRMRSMRVAQNFRSGTVELILALPLFLVSATSWMLNKVQSVMSTIRDDSVEPLAKAAEASSDAVANVVAPLLSTTDAASKEFVKVSEPVKGVASGLQKVELVATSKRKLGVWGQFWAENLKDLRQFLKAKYIRYTYVLASFYVGLVKKTSSQVSESLDKAGDGVADVLLDTIEGVQKAERNRERVFETKAYYNVRGAVVDTTKGMKDVKDKTAYELNVLKARAAAASTKSTPLRKKLGETASDAAKKVGDVVAKGATIPDSVSDGIADAVVGLTTAIGNTSPEVVKAEQEMFEKTSQMLEKTSRDVTRTSKELRTKTTEGLKEFEKKTSEGLKSTSETIGTIVKATEEFVEEGVKQGAKEVRKEVPELFSKLTRAEKDMEVRASAGLQSTSEAIGTIFQATEEYMEDGVKRGVKGGVGGVGGVGSGLVPKAQKLSKRVSYFSNLYVTNAIAKFCDNFMTGVKDGARSVARIGASIGFALAAAAVSMADYIFEVIFTFEFKRITQGKSSSERSAAAQKLYVEKRAADVYSSLYSLVEGSDRLKSGFNTYLESTSQKKRGKSDSDVYAEQFLEDIEGIQVSETKSLTGKRKLFIKKVDAAVYDTQDFEASIPTLLSQIFIAGTTKPGLDFFEYLSIPRYGAAVTVEGYGMSAVVSPEILPTVSRIVFAVANRDYTSIADCLLELGIIPAESSYVRQVIHMLNVALSGKSVDHKAYDAELMQLRGTSANLPACFFTLRQAVYTTEAYFIERARKVEAKKPEEKMQPLRQQVPVADVRDADLDPKVIANAKEDVKAKPSSMVGAKSDITPKPSEATPVKPAKEAVPSSIPDGLFRSSNTTAEPAISTPPTQPSVPDDLGLTRESVPSNIPQDPTRSRFMPRVPAGSRLYQTPEDSPDIIEGVSDTEDVEKDVDDAEVQYSAEPAVEPDSKVVDSEFLAKQLASILEVLPDLSDKMNEVETEKRTSFTGSDVAKPSSNKKTGPSSSVVLRSPASKAGEDYDEGVERQHIKDKMRDALEARKQVQGLVQSSWSNFMYMNSLPRDSDFTMIAKYLLGDSEAAVSLREMLIEESAAAVDLLFRQATHKSFERVNSFIPKPPGFIRGMLPKGVKLPFPVPRSLKKFNIRPRMMTPKQALEILAPDLSEEEEEYAQSLSNLASQTMGDDFGNVINGDVLLNPMAAMKIFLSVIATGKVPAMEDPAISGSSQRLLDIISNDEEAAKSSKDFNERLNAMLNSGDRFTDDENEVLAASANKLLERIRSRLADRLRAKLDIDE